MTKNVRSESLFETRMGKKEKNLIHQNKLFFQKYKENPSLYSDAEIKEQNIPIVFKYKNCTEFAYKYISVIFNLF